MDAGLQERTAELLRRSEAVLNLRPRTPTAPPPCGRGQRCGGRSPDGDPLQEWRASRRRGLAEAPPPVTSARRRSQSLDAWRGAEPRRERNQWDEADLPPSLWGSAMGQKAAAIELLQEAMDSDEAEAAQDSVLQELRDRRRRLRAMLSSVDRLLFVSAPPAAFGPAVKNAARFFASFRRFSTQKMTPKWRRSPLKTTTPSSPCAISRRLELPL